MGEGINRVHEKIASFTRRYYLNLLIRGSLLSLSIILAYFLTASVIEYNLWLGKGGRFLIFASFIAVALYSIFRFLKEPVSWWIYKKGLNPEESARLIGNYFPDVSDKLLNVIQLAGSGQPGPLRDAGISQKSVAFQHIAFESAVDLSENKRYLKYFLIPFALIVLLMFVNLGIFTQSAKRIVQFNQEFSPEAPFKFLVQNENLTAFFNEDFKLDLQVKGEALPAAVYLVSGEQRWKMESTAAGAFSYTFENLQNEVSLQFEASGFFSDPYKIQLINRPELTQLKVVLQFPSYLGLTSRELNNAGNLEIPEGTQVTWRIGASNTSTATIFFSSESSENGMQLIDNQLFTFSKPFRNPDDYSIVLENERSKNKDRISYSVNVIKDQYPQIVVDNLQDTALFKTILLGGTVNDDYGLTALKLNYQLIKDGIESPMKSIPVAIASGRQQENFFYQWKIDSLKLEPGDKISYHLQVWDNDGVNGRKSARSANYIFSLPGKEDLKAAISESQRSAENKIDQSIQKAKELRQSLDEAQQKLRGKQVLDWQDKKMLEDLVKQKEKLDEAIRKMQQENSMLEQKKEAFTEENERIREKSEQIQKLMDELLDEETKKLFDEMQKLLKENTDPAQLRKMLERMDRKEINLEKELERTLELFKDMQYDHKLEQAIKEIKEQKEKQEKLLSKTEELTEKKGDKKGEQKESKKNSPDKENSESGKEEKGSQEGQEKKTPEELAKEQEQLAKEFEEFKKSLEDLKNLGEELEKDEQMPSEEDQQEVGDSQKESKESLEQGKPQKSGEQQKKAVQKMQQMQQQMEGMQSSMQMEMDMQNLESLRQIIHGLIKLSFDQESLMKEFAPIQQTDPKYIKLSQDQLKLKDDAKVLEDSLLALAKKDAFLGSIVTKEVGELNDHIEKAVNNIRERRKGNASSEMQYSMTSINNLALMLNSHFDMMMDMMANAKPGKGKGKGSKSQSLSQMQQQLNQQMEEIKNGGKGGRQLSEEFAEMAAQQERIRRALEEMQQKLKQEGGKIPDGDLGGKMEQTEMDLVNKQITEQTIERQREILTRLLDSEKSMREQELDKERKGETAKDYTNQIPPAFEEYLRLKEKEVELLKTVPPKLFPYYKHEVSEYFKRIKTEN